MRRLTIGGDEKGEGEEGRREGEAGMGEGKIESEKEEGDVGKRRSKKAQEYVVEIALVICATVC